MARSPLADRLLTWAQRRRARVAGHNPWEVLVRLVRASAEDRVPGLGAEMAFFGLLALVPLLIAVGAGLGLLEHLLGVEQVADLERAVIATLAVVLGRDLTYGTLAPLVRGLLEQQRGGLAVTGLVVALYLASRVVGTTLHALDVAYGAPERRSALVLRALGLVYAVAGVVVVTLTFALAVAGPLLGEGEELAQRFDRGEAFALAWQLGRWPVLLATVVGFFMLIYRLGPAVAHRLRDCLPGAVLAVLLWVAVSLVFRLYLEVAGGVTSPAFDPQQEALATAGQVVRALIALVLWVYLSAMTVLVGGELNAELAAARQRGAQAGG